MCVCVCVWIYNTMSKLAVEKRVAVYVDVLRVHSWPFRRIQGARFRATSTRATGAFTRTRPPAFSMVRMRPRLILHHGASESCNFMELRSQGSRGFRF